MAVFKCKICGGNLDVQEGMSVCECEYCGTRQTLPKMNDQRRVNLYDRANHFRRNNEFDKAMSMYEQILEEDKEDAETYWSLVLCTYGIEYVEDPVDRTRKPTVNRTQFTSVFADENYKAALRYADESQRKIYEEEARRIDGIQKGILDISGKEAPFDVFICYKETDAEGRRTQDSVLANDLYHQLTQEGFKVFFARITLEDKLGSAYEPYIFAALNSAKVMVVLGTRPEYFNAVWVRNEWSRYLSLIKGGAKKVLIPAYRDMDPYDLPQEFSHLQSQDMGKLGFMQDLIRGIRKLTGEDQSVQPSAAAGASGSEETALLKRAYLFMEDGDFAKGDEYCERVLNLNPENGEAYLGKLMVQLKVCKREELAQNSNPLGQVDAYRKVMRFGNDTIKKELEGYNQQIIDRLKRQQERQQEENYLRALRNLQSAVTSGQVGDAMNLLKSMGNYKDAAAQLVAAAEKLAQLEKEEQEEREKAQAERKKAQKKTLKKAASVFVVVTVIVLVLVNVQKKRDQYNQAMEKVESLLQEGNYEEAYGQLVDIMDEKKAKEKITEGIRDTAIDCLEREEYQKAFALMGEIDKYVDNLDAELVISLNDVIYQKVQQYVSEEEYNKVKAMRFAIWSLSKSADTTRVAKVFCDALCQTALQCIDSAEYDKLNNLLPVIKDYSNGAFVMQEAEERINTLYRITLESLKQNQSEKAEASHALLNTLLNRSEMSSYRIPIEDTKVKMATTLVGETVDGWKEGDWVVVEKNENGEIHIKRRFTKKDFADDFSFSYIASSWKDSGLREWLNSDYLQDNFTSDEQKIIMTSEVQNECIRASITYGYDYSLSEAHGAIFVEDFWDKRKETEKTEDKIFLPLFSDSFEDYAAIGSRVQRSRGRDFYRSSVVLAEEGEDYEVLLAYRYTDSDGLVINSGHWGEGIIEDGFEAEMWVNPYAE
ncbi:MAG: toll/interleukin-1 receptor domain-containing protein [Butyrivibrio sp.]|nr:toll/interleukin-1 receptor domain-containing protein [Muribaculum sp.]MCM1552135.1 toll/interleukin-1 receptor domain-containing protein [Butyrivibrio sp.]